MRLPTPIQHGFTSVALLSIVAAGCGGDDNGDGIVDAGDNGNGNGIVDAGDNGIDAGDNGDVEDNLFTYVDTVVIPELDGDDDPTCCRDISDDGEIDNAYSELVASLADPPFEIDFQDTLDEQLDDGRLILLGEHAGLEGTSGAFTLNALRGNFADGTDREDAENGDGVFEVDDLSFDDQGEPRISFAAEVDEGELSASDESVVLLLPIADNALPFITRDVIVTADADVSEDAASYTSGEFSGYFLVDELFEMFNDFVTGESCECLGLGDGDDVFEKDGDDWAAGDRCVEDASASCDAEGEGLCAALAGEDALCEALPTVIPNSADLDIDGDEALSVGFEWSGVSAEVVEE